MQVKTTHPNETQATLTVNAKTTDLAPFKEQVLKKLQPQIVLPGFRKGNVPLELVEKNVNPTTIQTEFLEEAVSTLYARAIQQEQLKPVARPEIDIKKFVPYDELMFSATVAVIGNIKLPDYKKMKKSKPEIQVTPKDVDDVLRSLQTRLAEKKDVDRKAKLGDQVWIDFKGVDQKEQPIKGAEGKDYPLLLGSNTFIPGFEDNLIGLGPMEEKIFTLTFPKDYGVKALANKKVTFTAKVTRVQEVIDPKQDDAFAKKVGPFDSLKALREDIKRQLTHENQHEANRKFESELVQEISEKTKLNIPQALIDDQVELLMRDLRQNITYRGLTWQEFLELEGKTEEEYKEKELAPEAAKRVKASLVLAEIADKENVEVTPQEVDLRIQMLKQQYQDNSMQEELSKPESRRDITARLLTEKTVNKLSGYVQDK